MTENVGMIRNALKASFEDFIITRKERGALRKILRENPITAHQRRVLLSEVRNMALENSDSHRGTMLVEWMYEMFKLLDEPSGEAGEKPRVYFSPGTACREAISSQIRFAREQIRICVFTISDDEITAELLAAHRRGVRVSIITDDDKTFDVGSDIQRLKSMGIKTITDQSPVHMHHKFAIIDEDTVVTGSYNWTRSAATHNYENIVVMKERSVFRAYEQEFERLWKKLL